jgi:hypothetical protein
VDKNILQIQNVVVNVSSKQSQTASKGSSCSLAVERVAHRLLSVRYNHVTNFFVGMDS